jgi:catechol 2,3-dioxygenase-like lactoylglutathione lyase family enzyme
MFSDLTPIATLPASDLARARKFYEETLGLKPEREEEPGGVFYRCGGGQIFLYESTFAGTNKATAVTFSTDRATFDAEVDALRKKGISFLTFEYEGMKWVDDVMVTDDMKAVWFTDPEGNILNVGTM